MLFYLHKIIDSQELKLSTSDSQTSDELPQNLNAALSLPQEIISNIQEKSSALSIAESQ